MTELEATRLKLKALELVEGTVTQSYVVALFDYDKSTGIFTRKTQPSNRVKIGSTAGWKRRDCYIVIGINGVDYLAHRLAWLYCYGNWPVGVIDHIDGNPSNNSISNLRDVNQRINMLNVSDCQTNNQYTKLRGVTFHKKYRKYVAQLCINGKRKFLGHFNSPNDAHAVYLDAKKEACRKALANEKVNSASRAAAKSGD